MNMPGVSSELSSTCWWCGELSELMRGSSAPSASVDMCCSSTLASRIAWDAVICGETQGHETVAHGNS